jgi:hypothetical protein
MEKDLACWRKPNACRQRGKSPHLRTVKVSEKNSLNNVNFGTFFSKESMRNLNLSMNNSILHILATLNIHFPTITEKIFRHISCASVNLPAAVA